MSGPYRTDPEAQQLAQEAYRLIARGKRRRSAAEELRLAEINSVFGDHAESAINYMRAMNKP